MRLGGPLFKNYSDPEQWIGHMREKGYRAAYCPVGDTKSAPAYAAAAAKADVVIAEVGAWSNPLDPDTTKRKEAMAQCQRQLAVADAIGARCCVNIAGSMSSVWYGPHERNLTPETFDLIVQSVREIIDPVKPTRSFYSLETMPWLYPDSAESYERLIAAIDRRGFAVHFDPVNLLNSPMNFYQSGRIIREFVSRLGQHIKSCHAKDLKFDDSVVSVHFDEVRPGLGELDYATFLKEVDRIDPQMPLLMEHLATEPEYDEAAAHIRAVARKQSVSL